ncbi:MAG: cytochrome P450 [Deltaproteobacteria bacterium]|nr:MAG: cytochrome P450 [Deltaproteobacteria bacterium]
MSTPTIPGPKQVMGLDSIQAVTTNPADYLLHLANTYGDIASFRMLTKRFVMVQGLDYVGEVLVKQASKFEKAKRDRDTMDSILGLGLVTSEGELHKRQRKLVQPAFRKKRIELYAEAMCRQVERLLEQWTDGQHVDMSEEMMQLTMYIVTDTLFRMDVSEEADRVGESIALLQDIVQQNLRAPIQVPRWIPTSNNRKAKEAGDYLNNLIRSMIARRREEEAQEGWVDHGDLMSTLLQAAEDGSTMSDQQVVDELQTLFVAGHETTSNALSWTWYLLSQHPEVEAKLHSEVDRVLQGRPVTVQDLVNLPYTTQVLKESMRLYPPAWTLNVRQAKEEVKLGEYVLPKGTLVFVSPYVVHRNPSVFPDPETFDPERFTPEQEAERHRHAYIPFGAGPRVCIGNSFAMMEAALIVARLAQTYRFVLDPKQVVEPLPQITMSPRYGLDMTIEKRQPVLEQTEEVAPAKQSSMQGCPFHTQAA